MYLAMRCDPWTSWTGSFGQQPRQQCQIPPVGEHDPPVLPGAHHHRPNPPRGPRGPHHPIQEYLLGNSAVLFPRATARFAVSCLRYLMSEDLRAVPWETEDEVELRLDDHPFAEYLR